MKMIVMRSYSNEDDSDEVIVMKMVVMVIQ